MIEVISGVQEALCLARVRHECSVSIGVHPVRPELNERVFDYST